MTKSRITGLLRYVASITLCTAITVGSVMVLLDAPRAAAQAQAKGATVATFKQAASTKPLPQLTARDFDIYRWVKVVVAGKPEPKALAAPIQTASLQSTAPAAVLQAGSATVIADAVNLRAAASKQSARVLVVRRGTRVAVHESERGWTRITTEDGMTGWLASKFLDQ